MNLSRLVCALAAGGCVFAQANANPIATPPEILNEFPWGKCCLDNGAAKSVPWRTVQEDARRCIGDLSNAATQKAKDLCGNPDALGFHSEKPNTAYAAQTTHTVPAGTVVRVAMLSDDDATLTISGGGLTEPKVITTPAGPLWGPKALVRKEYALHPGTYTLRLTYHNHSHWEDRGPDGRVAAKDVDGVSVYLVQTLPIDVDLDVGGINTDGAAQVHPGPVKIGSPLGPEKWADNQLNHWPQKYTARARPFLYIDATPAMPRMVANLDLSKAGLTRSQVKVKWGAQTKYDRLKLATDSGMKEDTDQNLDGRWDVAAALGAARLYGGEGDFHWLVRDLQGEVLCGGLVPYAIRGKNPAQRQDIRSEVDRDIAAQPQGITDALDRVRAAMDAIVQAESKGRQFNWTDGRGPTDQPGHDQTGHPAGTLVNANQPNGPTYKDDYPMHHANHSSDGVGIGLTQYTWKGRNPPITAEKLADITWDWKKNLAAGASLFTADKAKASTRIVAIHRTRAGKIKEPYMQVHKMAFAIDGEATDADKKAKRTLLSNELATAIKLYNGAGRNPIPGNDNDDSRDLDDYTSKTQAPLTDNHQNTEQIPVVFWNHKEINPQTNTEGVWQLQTETTVKDYVTEVLNQWP